MDKGGSWHDAAGPRPGFRIRGGNLAGYASAENRDRIAKSGAAVVVGSGSGRVLLLPDDPAFRAYWLGSQRLLFNAVFFGPQVRLPGAAGASDPGDDDEG